MARFHLLYIQFNTTDRHYSRRKCRPPGLNVQFGNAGTSLPYGQTGSCPTKSLLKVDEEEEEEEEEDEKDPPPLPFQF